MLSRAPLVVRPSMCPIPWSRRAAVALAVTLGATAAWSQPRPSWSLRWDAPATCPGPAAVRARVATLVGGEAQREARVQWDVTVRVDGTGYAATVRALNEGVATAQTLTAPRCDELAETAALLLAWTVQPEGPPTTPASAPAAPPATTPAPPPPPPRPRAARTEDPTPRPIVIPSTVARRRLRAVLAETEATAAPAPPPVTPPPAPPRPALEEPSPAPAPSLAPASVAGRAPPADANVGLPPDLVVLAEARALLRAGDARGALARLERFAAEHPDAPRAVERTGARLIARCAEGIAGAREVSEYLSHHGDSPLATGVRDRCATLIPPSR